MKIKTNNLFGKEILIDVKKPELGNWKNPKRMETIFKKGADCLHDVLTPNQKRKLIRKKIKVKQNEKEKRKA